MGSTDIRFRAGYGGHPMPLNREPGCGAVISEQFLVSRLNDSAAVMGGVRLPAVRQIRARCGVGPTTGMKSCISPSFIA
jgi:hypothetical protein